MKLFRVFILLLIVVCFIFYSSSRFSEFQESIIGTWYLDSGPWLTFEFEKDRTMRTYRGTERKDLQIGTYAFISSQKILVELANEDNTKTAYELKVSFPHNDVLVLSGFADLLREKTFKRLEKVTDGIEKRYLESGALYSECAYENGILDGACKGYYPSGMPRFERNYREGKLDGAWRMYYRSGQLMNQSNYKDGKTYGLAKLYHENGTIAAEVPFERGTVKGTVKSYYENGALTSTISYTDNVKDGIAKYYDEEGNLTKEEVYEDDTLINSPPL